MLGKSFVVYATKPQPRRRPWPARRACAERRLPGVLNTARIARTVGGIAALQRPDGAIPWFHGDHLDPWDHVEAAMALDAAGEHEAARRPRTAGWRARRTLTVPGTRPTPTRPAASEPTDGRARPTSCAYMAVGVWHH